MNLDQERAIMLAEQLSEFIDYVEKSYVKKNPYLSDQDKLFRLKMLIEECRFKIIASELKRVNTFVYDEKVTTLLMERFKKGIDMIDEYVGNNKDDLFIFTPRIEILKWFVQERENELVE